MDQLCMFEDAEAHGDTWQLYIDGASRNNPGPSGAGIVIKKNGIPIKKEGYYLGSKTNNQAEYLALVLGVIAVTELMAAHDTLTVISDSQLLVRQLQGAYRVKNLDLKILYNVAKKLLGSYACEIKHVLREYNKEADAMANKGVDSLQPVPQTYRDILDKHSVRL